MKIHLYCFLILSLFACMISCDSKVNEIDSGLVQVDETTKKYTFKESGQSVSGQVVFYETDVKSGRKFRVSLREVQGGVRRNMGYDYFPDGKIRREYPYDERGKIRGTVKHYYENGRLFVEASFKDNVEDGITRVFNESGRLIKEINYAQGTKINESEIDENGHKKKLTKERVEAIAIESGYYKYTNRGEGRIYQPTVKIEFKNISGKTLNENIKAEGIFFSSGKEWSRSSDFLQGASDPPLENGQTRKILLKSNAGQQMLASLASLSDSCMVLLNSNHYKTVLIQNVSVSLE
jgi:hypothetical protein